MAKIQLKSDNINPFGGLFSIFNQFDRSGIRSVIDGHLGKRGSTSARASAYDTLAKATILKNRINCQSRPTSSSTTRHSMQ